jgi:hypothetical protein
MMPDLLRTIADYPHISPLRDGRPARYNLADC